MKKLLLFLFAVTLSAYVFGQTVQSYPGGQTDQGTPMMASSQTGSGFIQNGNPVPNVMSAWVLPNTNSTSGNSRIPRNAGAYFQREELLILSSEMAASGYPSGVTVDALGFLIATAGVGTQTGTLNIYLMNTSDVTYTLGSTWTTTGFTMVSTNAAFTVPIAAGSYTIPFVGGSTFTYTGGGVYVAWEFSNPTLVGGTTALVAYCNTNQASMCYGYQSATSMGTGLTLTAFRPATYFVNNSLTDIAQVTNIYTTERTPTPYGTPTPVGVRINNVSAASLTCNLTITIKDVPTSTVRYTATLPVTALAAGTGTTITFPGWTPTLLEDVTINAATSAIAGETFVANNSLTITGSVNKNLYSYCYNLASINSGYGYTYPGTGTFLAKYTMNGTGVVKGANIFIYNYATNPGNVIYAVLLNSAGTILQQTPNYTLLLADMGTNMSFTFPATQSFTNEIFYVGLAMTAGGAQWYPLGIATESPARGNTFYTGLLTGGVPTADVATLKYGIEAVLVAPPTVTTTAATPIGTTTATLNGTVNANGTNSTVTFQYGLTVAYGSTVAGVPATATGSSNTTETAAIIGLAQNTLYHFRAVAVNTGGTTYGNDMTFTTLALPTVVTTAASAIAATTATVNGTVNANGYSTTTSFDYGLTVAYGTNVPGVPLTVTGITVFGVLANLTGLLPGTLYHYRINGINAGGTVNGGDLTFTTLALAPTVVTNGATGVGPTTATLNGTITANGSNTTASFDWGLTIAYGSNTAAIPVTVTGNTATAVSANLAGLTLGTTYHYRAKGINGIGTTLGTDMTFTTGCPQAGPAGPVTGPISVCQGGTGYVYTVAPIANASGYNWTVPVGGTITAGTNTNTITVSYSPTAVSGYVYVYGTASCGNGSPSQLAVTVNVSATPTLIGPANVCINSTGNIYTTQSGMTNYVWTVSAGGTITGGGTVTSNTVTVTWTTTGAKTVCVNYNNAAGCPALAPVCYNVTVNSLPTPTILGPNPACTGIPGLTYSTQAGMTNYIWAISAGGTITGGSTTNTITVTWGTAGAQTISINYTNPNGCTATVPVVYPVTVNPTTIPVITGTTDLCINTGYYNYTTQAGMINYIWTISGGGTITNGMGTNVLQVLWNSVGAQTVSVIFTNGSNLCTAPNPTVLPVNVNGLPDAAGTITGTATVCAGAAGVVYSVPTINNAVTYVWTLPTGATIASGSGTNSITVNFANNASSGNITVYGNSICGNGATSSPFAVNVTQVPATAGTITGTPAVCIGATGVVYSVDPIANATSYNWTIPNDVTITGGFNSNSITVDFYPTAVSGNFSVAGTNSCGDGTASPDYAVSVNPVPPTPVITLVATGDALTSDALAGNQWYLDGILIPGATSQTYVPTQTGHYTVVVTINGCSSAVSNDIYFVMTGIEPLVNGSSVSVYPNPGDGLFTLNITTKELMTLDLSVVNNLGITIYQQKDLKIKGTQSSSLDLRSQPDGVYSIILKNNNKHMLKKIVINR
ncbi:MAG: T9SS type A sorting domain-containing protein [Bacteroidetes bacterium]|nr:T9SS type A sorting domain-containing protein [Bacteroidota bacterium]